MNLLMVYSLPDKLTGSLHTSGGTRCVVTAWNELYRIIQPFSLSFRMVKIVSMHQNVPNISWVMVGDDLIDLVARDVQVVQCLSGLAPVQ